MIATGTFLKGVVHIGRESFAAGRFASKRAAASAYTAASTRVRLAMAAPPAASAGSRRRVPTQQD